MFNNNAKDQHFADKKDSSSKNQVVRQKEIVQPVIKNQENNLAQTNNSNSIIVKKSNTKKQEGVTNKKESPIIPLINNELPIANNETKVETPQPIANNELTTTNKQLTTNNNEAIALIENKNETKKTEEFLSLKELAAEKFKEKTLDSETMAMQKKNGRAKKFTGWDLAQLITRGASKLTGRNLEVKPTYNDNGEITAYAFGNGIEISKGR